MTSDASQTKKCLRVLHLEDDKFDAELIQCELQEHNIPCSITRIDTRAAFEAALQKDCFDLILSDSQLPGFDTVQALGLARQRCPEVPFIFVSGAASPKIKGDALRLGASDFISKDQLPRLVHLLNWLFSSHPRKRRIPALPETGTPVTVQCKDFRCLGYLDREGTWRDFKDSTELPEVIDWSDL